MQYSIEKIIAHAHRLVPLQKPGYDAFLIVLKGNICVKWAGRSYELSGNDCGVLGQEVVLECEMCQAVYLSFQRLEDIPYRACRQVKLDGFLEGMERLSELKALGSQRGDQVYQVRANKLIWELLLGFYDTAEGQLKSQNIQDVKAYVDRHFCDGLSLDFLAERFGISKYHMSRLFKARYGSTINRYMVELRLEKARKLLAATTSTVREIAYACGFNNPEYFNKEFKRLNGLTPMEYRNENGLGLELENGQFVFKKRRQAKLEVVRDKNH